LKGKSQIPTAEGRKCGQSKTLRGVLDDSVASGAALDLLGVAGRVCPELAEGMAVPLAPRDTIPTAVASDEWQETDKGRRPKRGRLSTLTINQAAHTSPHRLSAVPGAKMNQIANPRMISNLKAQSDDRKSAIENRQLTGPPTLPRIGYRW